MKILMKKELKIQKKENLIYKVMDFLNQNLIYSKTYKDLSIRGNLKNIFYF